MATRMSGAFLEVVMARRTCTVWSRKTEGGGWDCLVICDPPIRRVLTDFSGRQGFDVAISPYNGGYPDFTPHEDQIKAPSRPPLTSLLDDLRFYIQNRPGRLGMDEPLCAILFLEKILRKSLYESDRAWERRVAAFKGDLRGITLQLRISPSELELDRPGDMGASAADYRFLPVRFTEIGQLVSSVNGSISSLVSIAGSRSALKAQKLSSDMANRLICDAKNTRA
ncbi:hypothetical protein F5Y06DRAFT_305150 [Hypoxylon sp. FL0890]|nr:hypothetical protein F5Y06DRAFT_305150 [Hypoxylon sp. FL0890]